MNPWNRLFRKRDRAVDAAPPQDVPLACPYCHGSDFIPGPKGPGAQNILCANPECRHWFNLMLGNILDDLERVEPTDEEKRQDRAAQRAAEATRVARLKGEGRAAFADGKQPEEILQDGASGYRAAEDNVSRLLGYIDAMSDAAAAESQQGSQT
jgi:hypothetical protein